MQLERTVTLRQRKTKKVQHETTRKKYKKIATVHHKNTFNMKRMQYGKRCNMKRVQDEKSVTRTEKVQPKKCATRKKSNMKRVQREKTSTWKNAK